MRNKGNDVLSDNAHRDKPREMEASYEAALLRDLERVEVHIRYLEQQVDDVSAPMELMHWENIAADIMHKLGVAPVGIRVPKEESND